MKKFLCLICATLFCTTVTAHNIDWYVDGQIYQTTTCASGDSVTPPTPPAKYGYHFVEWMPYTPIEYIESAGKQYIDTEIVSTGYTIEISFTLNIFGTGMGFFGYNYNDNGTQRRQGLGVSSSGQTLFGYGDGNNTAYLGFLPLSTNVLYTIVAHYPTSTYCEVNGTRYNVNSSARSNPISIFIMGLNQKNAIMYSYMKLYYAKIWDNDTLVRDMIPVLDKNGVACMYDKVSNTFFYNAGTGDFVAGPKIGE